MRTLWIIATIVVVLGFYVIMAEEPLKDNNAVTVEKSRSTMPVETQTSTTATSQNSAETKPSREILEVELLLEGAKKKKLVYLINGLKKISTLENFKKNIQEFVKTDKNLTKIIIAPQKNIVWSDVAVTLKLLVETTNKWYKAPEKPLNPDEYLRIVTQRAFMLSKRTPNSSEYIIVWTGPDPKKKKPSKVMPPFKLQIKARPNEMYYYQTDSFSSSDFHEFKRHLSDRFTSVRGIKPAGRFVSISADGKVNWSLLEKVGAAAIEVGYENILFSYPD